jgi:predicted anti-sigma-YlaC factor YlaD
VKEVPCGEVREKLSDYIDQETLDEICREIEAHLAHCDDCRVEVDTVKKTIMLYQKGSSVEVPIRATAKLSAALAREYRLSGGPQRTD